MAEHKAQSRTFVFERESQLKPLKDQYDELINRINKGDVGFPTKETISRHLETLKIGLGAKTQYRMENFYPDSPETPIKTIEANFKKAIRELRRIIEMLPQPDNTVNTYSCYTIYYWDWDTDSYIEDVRVTGNVVSGEIHLPEDWTTYTYNSKSGDGDPQIVLRLHNGHELTGKIWIQKFEPSKYNVSILFRNSDRFELNLLLCIDVKKISTINILAGGFLSVEKSSPRHGTFILEPCSVRESLKVTNLASQAKQKNEAISQKIQQSLFQQTYTLEHIDIFPLSVDQANRFLVNNLIGRTFVGYFIQAKEEALENFKLRIEENGRCIIEYHKDRKTSSGYFQLYNNSVIWLEFDYDEDKYKVHRYRMLFCKDLQTNWFYGICSGAESGGNSNMFMNRVAMIAKEDSWESVQVAAPIFLNSVKPSDLTDLAPIFPDLRKYLSKPTIGGLGSGKVELLFSNHCELLAGEYLLYSLAREVTEQDEEYYEIVEMPLIIKPNGLVEMKGEKSTYFGQAEYEAEKLVIYFNERLMNGASKRIRTYMTCYVKIIWTDDRLLRLNVGVLSRFVDAMPEARTIILEGVDEAKRTESEVSQLRRYVTFSDEWRFLRASERGYLTRYFAGRINRLIVPYDNKKKRPERRQKPFRELFAHAALSQINLDSELFIEYFHQAVLHSFGEEDADRQLFERLVTELRQLQQNANRNWSPTITKKMNELNMYIENP